MYNWYKILGKCKTIPYLLHNLKLDFSFSLERTFLISDSVLSVCCKSTTADLTLFISSVGLKPFLYSKDAPPKSKI